MSLYQLYYFLHEFKSVYSLITFLNTTDLEARVEEIFTQDL
jgi:hypothetical protein